MAILIDGYNLLHATGFIAAGATYTSLEGPRRSFLNFLCERLTPDEARDTTVVFDAAEAPAGLPIETFNGNIRVLFARDHAEADDLIEELIRANHVPQKLIVVSSDHRIHRAARRRRATAVDSDVWYWDLHDREIVSIDKQTEIRGRNSTLDPTEVDDWLRVFKVPSSQDSAARSTAPIETPLNPTPKPTPASKNGPPNRAKDHSTRREQGAGDSIRTEQHGSQGATSQDRDAMQRPSKEETSQERGSRKKAIRQIESDPIFPPGYGEDLLDSE